MILFFSLLIFSFCFCFCFGRSKRLIAGGEEGKKREKNNDAWWVDTLDSGVMGLLFLLAKLLRKTFPTHFGTKEVGQPPSTKTGCVSCFVQACCLVGSFLSYVPIFSL